MTPHDRFTSAMEHREPDRVPIDFSGHRSSGIAAIASDDRVALTALGPNPTRWPG